MKNISLNCHITFISIVLILSVSVTDCKKSDNPVKFQMGTFPDSVANLSGLNSAYDDYNSTIYEISGSLPIIFSSNRKSSGGQFDLEQGNITFTFDQTDGSFSMSSSPGLDPFYSNLIAKAETPLNDFGPYRTFSSIDGKEYLILSSENTEGNLDLQYFTNMPMYGSVVPAVNGPFPVNLINTSFDDGYLAFDLNLDSAYFISNIEGNFNIYLKSRPAGTDISAWLDSDYSPSALVDSINSSANDKCPILHDKLIVFTSDRPGGYGGFDLYYAVFRKGNWSSPVNFGPGINSSSDEYRPVIGSHNAFSNLYMIFSSNRPGGEGGYDLYFTGIEPPE